MLSPQTRQKLQRLLDEVAQRRRAALDAALAPPPPPGFVREANGKERPATKPELRAADRLLAKHLDLANRRPDDKAGAVACATRGTTGRGEGAIQGPGLVETPTPVTGCLYTRKKPGPSGTM
jgi:hypothetical protein